MKWLFGILMVIVFGLQCEARNRALLIGIGSYPQGSGWCSISSEEDLGAISSSLPSNFSVQTLVNKEATKSGIESALLQLANRTESGDTIIIHFSTHGQQMLSDDPSEKDNLDEAIIPYDARLKESESYHGEAHLRDDELGHLIKDIADKAGKDGLVLVTIDACHSGDINRGETNQGIVYRGVEEVFGAERLSEEEKDRLRSLHYTNSESEIERAGNEARVIYFSACRSRERNQQVAVDGTQMGSLSTALARNLKNHSLQDTKDFLDGLYSEMIKLSIPQSPEVKTNFGYVVPLNEIPEAEETENEEAQTSSFIPLLIAFGVLVIILICLFLWKRKKRKDYPESY